MQGAETMREMVLWKSQNIEQNTVSSYKTTNIRIHKNFKVS